MITYKEKEQELLFFDLLSIEDKESELGRQKLDLRKKLNDFAVNKASECGFRVGDKFEYDFNRFVITKISYNDVRWMDLPVQYNIDIFARKLNSKDKLDMRNTIPHEFIMQKLIKYRHLQ